MAYSGLMKNKEKEVEEAEKSFKNVRADELRKMSPEDYLFRFLSNPELEKRLNESRETNNQEDSSRLVSIVMKLRLEKAWVEGTLL